MTPGGSAEQSDAEGEDEISENGDVPMVNPLPQSRYKDELTEQASASMSRASEASEGEDPEFSGGEDEIEDGADYEDEGDYDDDDDPMDDDGDDDDDDPSFGEKKKKKSVAKIKIVKEPRSSGPSKPKKRE